MRYLATLILAILLLAPRLNAAGPTPLVYSLTSSNATVTFVTNINGLILDLTANVPASTNSGNWIAVGSTNANLPGISKVYSMVVTQELQLSASDWFPYAGGIIMSNNTTHPFTMGSGLPLGNPPSAPVVATNGAVGNLNGTYSWAYTEDDLFGETGASPTVTLTVTNAQVMVTTPYPRSGASERKLYRTAGGGAQLKLVYNFGGGDHWHQRSYVDNIADGALGANVPTSDTTRCYEMQVSEGVKRIRTNPAFAGIADITVLTADVGTSGSLAMDLYGPIYVRNILGANYQSLHTGNSGQHFVALHQSDVAPTTWTPVFGINAGGSVDIIPDGTDGTIYGLRLHSGGFGVDAGGADITGTVNITGPEFVNGTSGTAPGTMIVTSPGVNGRHANIYAPATGTGNNNLFWGADTNNFLCSLGFLTAAKDAVVDFFCYESTNSNGVAYSGTANAPTRIRVAHTTGDFFIESTNAGPANTDAQMMQNFRVFNHDGVVVGQSPNPPGLGSLEVDTNLTVSYGIVNIGLPTFSQGTLNVENEHGLGRHASIQAYGGGTSDNNIFWGHPATNYLSSFGHNSGSGDAQIMFYSYGSSNANKQAYSGTINAPSMIQADVTTGLLSFYGAAVGAANADITWTKGLTINPLLSSLSYSYATNITSLASSTAVAQVLSATNVATIGQHTSDNSLATNGYNVPTIGKGITIKAGANGKLSSTAETLSAGTVVVNNTSITANSKVFLQPTTVSPVSGVLAVTAKSVGTSFTVTSSNNQDTNQFSWFIVEAQ